MDALTTNEVEDNVLSSSVEFVYISINTLNTSLLLRCINRALDSLDSVNDFIINAFIHASAVNFNTKAVTGDFNCPWINWNTDSFQNVMMNSQRQLTYITGHSGFVP